MFRLLEIIGEQVDRVFALVEQTVWADRQGTSKPMRGKKGAKCDVDT